MTPEEALLEPFIEKSHCRHCGMVIYRRETASWYHVYGASTRCSRIDRTTYAEPTDNVRTI